MAMHVIVYCQLSATPQMTQCSEYGDIASSSILKALVKSLQNGQPLQSKITSCYIFKWEEYFEHLEILALSVGHNNTIYDTGACRSVNLLKDNTASLGLFSLRDHYLMSKC